MTPERLSAEQARAQAFDRWLARDPHDQRDPVQDILMGAVFAAGWDARQAEIDRLTEALRLADQANVNLLHAVAARDAQVAALREFAESLTDGRQCGDCGQPWADLQGHSDDCRIAPLLADTESAAREHDRRLRLEGARELYRRMDDAHDLVDVLAEMEREAGQ